MSGPAPSERLYESYSGSIDWDRSRVSELRRLADRVENGLLVGDDSELPNEQVANLLRAKADKIEAALRTIDSVTNEDYNKLVKNIQYNFSGDYGADSVVKAWDKYGEKDE